MIDQDLLQTYIKALGKPATFHAEAEKPLRGFITGVFIHNVDGEPVIFIGMHPTNVPGVSRNYFNTWEVDIEEQEATATATAEA